MPHKNKRNQTTINNTDKKTSNEKPISLHPIEIDDALRALLTTPLPKEKDAEKSKHK